MQSPHFSNSDLHPLKGLSLHGLGASGGPGFSVGAVSLQLRAGSRTKHLPDVEKHKNVVVRRACVVAEWQGRSISNATILASNPL